jgi:hypothetical protein
MMSIYHKDHSYRINCEHTRAESAIKSLNNDNFLVLKKVQKSILHHCVFSIFSGLNNLYTFQKFSEQISDSKRVRDTVTGENMVHIGE